MPPGFTDFVSTGLPYKLSRDPTVREGGGGRHETPEEGQGGSREGKPGPVPRPRAMPLWPGTPGTARHWTPPDRPIPFPRQPWHGAQLPPGARWMFICSPVSKAGCDTGTSSVGGLPKRPNGPALGWQRGPALPWPPGRPGRHAHHSKIMHHVHHITCKIILQSRAQPLGSPSGCFLLEKGVSGRVAAPRGTGPEGDPPQGVAAGALRAFLRQIGLSPSSRALAPGEPAPPRLAALAPAPREHGACESSHAVLAPDPGDKSRCLKGVKPPRAPKAAPRAPGN